jgi:hypothetical protein
MLNLLFNYQHVVHIIYFLLLTLILLGLKFGFLST